MVRAQGALASTSRMPTPAIVDPVNFLLATRDTGYRSSAQSIAEFVDNSFQAHARRVSVAVTRADDEDWPLQITITDDGEGMDATALGRALTFGGSTRFDDRQSLGRYGMGLPNGALSRARRVEVYSWRGGQVLWSRLDLDEVATLKHRTLAPIEVPQDLPFVPATPTGTVVRLLRCDRIEYKRPSWLVRRLHEEFGRIYRRFLIAGKRLAINGRAVSVIDPLFLAPESEVHGARPFGDELVYHLASEKGEGDVRVRFAELPVERWHGLSVDEKRDRGITNAPSVSVLRADREIDRGWFFMGGKRRENYDDWWRCEVHFDPTLDEYFGITHSKQAIVASEDLLKVLVPDLEPIARALNGRVRQRFDLVRSTEPLGAAERQAGRADQSLPPLPRRKDVVPDALKDLVTSADRLKPASPYQIVASELPSTAAFEVVARGGRLLLLLNSRHPLYRDLYGPLAASESSRDQDIAKQVALAILAAARAEVSTWRRADGPRARAFRQTWADVLSTFMSA